MVVDILERKQRQVGGVSLIVVQFWFNNSAMGGGGRTGLVVRASDSGSGDPGFDPRPGRCVVSLSKRYLLPKSTGNTQE